jgi:hypothetical protein
MNPAQQAIKWLTSPFTRKPAQEPEVQKSYLPNTYGYWGSAPVQRDGITALFANMWSESRDAGLSNPREHLDAYRQIYKNFPQFADVVKRKRDLIGNPVIESATDPVWADEMNQFLANIRSIGEVYNPFAYDMGITCLLDQLIETIYVDGSGFATMLDVNGKMLEGRQKLDAVRVHDPMRFWYQQREIDVYELWYQTKGESKIITGSKVDAFKALQFDRTQWIWGKPLAYHSEYILRLYLVALGAREQANARAGAPLELTIFGFKLPNNFDPAMGMKMTNEARNYAEAAAQKYREAIGDKQTKLNEGVDVVGVAPSDMSVTSHMYGKDVQFPSEFTDEVSLYLKWAASSWGYPLALIGMDDGSDGLGSAKYAYAAAIANLAAHNSQMYLSKNIIQPLIDRRMLDERKTAPREYRIVWTGKTLEDQKNEADVAKVKAETLKLQLEAYEMALMNLSPAEQEAIVRTMPWGK